MLREGRPESIGGGSARVCARGMRRPESSGRGGAWFLVVGLGVGRARESSAEDAKGETGPGAAAAMLTLQPWWA